MIGQVWECAMFDVKVDSEQIMWFVQIPMRLLTCIIMLTSGVTKASELHNHKPRSSHLSDMMKHRRLKDRPI
jgi:hypothetical protein